MPLLVPPPRLDNFRDGHHFSLIADAKIQDHVHHFVDNSVELVLRDIAAIEALVI